jgi:hypothetical protein
MLIGWARLESLWLNRPKSSCRINERTWKRLIVTVLRGVVNHSGGDENKN